MNNLLKPLFLSISFLIAPFSGNFIYAQEPCEPAECCLDNEGFEEYPLGSLQTSLPFQTPGYYAQSGNVQVIGEGHFDAQSIRMISTASTLGYAAGGGFGGLNPVFAVDNEYCIELCLLVASDHGPINLEISTENGVIYTSPSYSFSGSWITISLPTYFASTDHFDLFFNIIGTPETEVHLDNICLDVYESVDCMADFELESISECREYCFINKSCGDMLNYKWSVRNAANIEVHSANTEDLCYAFTQPGVYTVILAISDEMGCEDQIQKEFNIDFTPFEYSCDYDESITLSGGPDCTYDYTVPFLTWSGGVVNPIISVFVNGIQHSEGDLVPLMAGSNTILYTITNECGLEADCIYEITITCIEELPEQCGWMVISCVGSQSDPVVAGLYDTRINSNAPPGNDWNNTALGVNQIGKIIPNMWNINDIGQVFGIALDNAGGNIYLAASDVYEYDDIYNYFNGTNVGPAGRAGIYVTNFSTVNTTTPLVTTIPSNVNVIGTNMIPNTGNTGNGIGNIVYDEMHNQLFATNLEDGRIYRIDATLGIVLSVFDPFVLDTGANGLAALGERIWAVGLLDDGVNRSIYFSRQTSLNDQIWSIPLDASGEFVATQSSPNIYDDSASSSVPEFMTLPPNNRSKVTDIAFSSEGRMIIGERGDPHFASTYECIKVGGSWIPGNNFYTGPNAGSNTAGGVDYGSREKEGLINFDCDDIVWSTMNYAFPTNLSQTVYGVQGKDAGGNSANAAIRHANDLYIDANGVYGTQDKSGIGDVEIFKCGCPPESSSCDSLMVMSRPTPTECMDPSIITGNPCPFVYDPVCGCDGNTYGNACEAGEAGITTISPGECDGNNTPPVEDGCCYIIDLKNNYGPGIVELEAELLTPEWIFNTTTLTAPFTFGSCGSLNNKFCIHDPNGGSIPQGISFNAITTCFTQVVSNPTTLPIVEFKWKELVGDEEMIVVCRDTLDFFCDTIPPPDTCLVIESDTIRCLGSDNPSAYEYCFTLTNKSGQDVSQIVLDDLSPGFTFLPFNTSSKIVVPNPNALPDQATSAQICVQVESSIPITGPSNFCIKMGLIAEDGSECCHSPVEICKEIEPCCSPCDDKSITFNSINMNEDDCCYSVDITNACAIPYFTKIEAVINTPGVCFGSHVIGSSHTGNWNVSSTPQSICLTPFGGIMDQTSYQDLFSFCLDKIDEPFQANPSITINWYAIDPTTGQQIVVCEDAFTTDCPVGDNTCVIISDGDLICLPDSNKYRYTFTVTNVSQPGFIADRLHLNIKNDPSWVPVPSGPVIILNPPLAPGNSTTITTCINGPTFPATFSDFVFGYRLQNLQDGDCCFESMCDTIPVPPCTDCCDEERLDQEIEEYLNTLSIDGCKLSLGPIELDSCVGMTINWGDTTGDHYHMDSLTCKIYDEAGIYNVCVQWEVYPEMGVFPCYLRDTCFNVEIDDCTSDCFTAVDLEIKDVICDSINCYEQPFCLPWLVDDIGNINCTGYFLPYFDKAIYNGQPVIIKWQPTIEGLSHTIYDCSGLIIQSCTPSGGGGLSCFPDAGIDVTTDLAATVTIWNCGDAVPTLDASCPIGKSIEYCVKLMNNTPNDAANVQLSPILPPGISIMPNVIPVSIPSGGMSTITFMLSGPLMTGIDTKINASLIGTTSAGEEWSCSDTLCLPTPPCPPLDCCQNKDTFDILVAQSLLITDLGDCRYEVCANQFTDCHWFWTVSPDWGDGTIIQPTLTQSDSPNNCWTHTYTTPGPHTITLNVEEQNADGEACWNGQMQAEVGCELNCCDNMNEDQFCLIFDQVLDYTIEECNTVCWTSPANPCDYVQIDFGDNSQIVTISNGETVCHSYTMDSIYSACIKLYRINDITGDTCFMKEECVDIVIDCFPPICADCPDGSTPGPNLVVNGDFENLNVGFNSGLTFIPPPLLMGPGQYGVRTNTTMGNWFWDNSANTSNFLQADGLSNTIIWSQSVNVIIGETYIFCAEFDNLVDPFKLTESTSPTVSIRVDGVAIPGLSNIPINHLPNAVQVVSGSWANTGSTSVNLDIFMDNVGTYGDIAIDNVSFAQCGGCDIGGNPCELVDIQVNEQPNSCCFEVEYDNQYCSNYFKGFMVTTVSPNTVSQVQAKPGWYVNQITPYVAEVYPLGTFPLGTGIAFVICGDNMISSTLDFTVSWLIPTPTGCEAICEESFTKDCGSESSCITIIDDIIDCNQYCFRVTNNTSPGFTINSIVLDQLAPAGAIINPNPISIPGLAPGATSSIICVDYFNLLPGDTFCYNVVAHDIDITSGELPTWCCTDPIAKCATVPDDCAPCDDLSLITSSVAQGDSCCWSVDIVNGYHGASFVGIRAKVVTSGAYFANISTTPDWSLDFVAANEYIFDYDSGTGFIPLGTNITGDFCLTGYSTGLQQVEFSWLQVDPMTGDTIDVCPVVIDSDCPAPPPPLPCSDISDEVITCVDDMGNYTMTFNLSNNTHLFGTGFNALSYALSNLTTTGSMVVSPIHNNLSPILMPGQTSFETLNISAAVPGDSLCFSITLHDQVVGGAYNNCCTADTVWCFVIPDDAPCSDTCCDSYNLDSLSQDVNQTVVNYAQDSCEICFNGEFPDCVNWYVDWGDGSTSIGTSVGSDTRCQTYETPTTYTACLYSWVLDMNGDTCLTYNQCIDVNPDCDTNCCDITDEEYDELFEDILDYEFEDTCNLVCFYLDGEACDSVIINFDDGTIVGPISADSDEQCHQFDSDGVYNVCLTMFRRDDDDPTINCMERDTCIAISVDCDTSLCCDGYSLMDLNTDLNQAIGSVSGSENCDASVTMAFSDCVEWTVDWGDGTSDIDIANNQSLTHSYLIDSTYNVCLTGTIQNANDSICLTATECIMIDVTGCTTTADCDPSTWNIPNGLTPNGDAFNEELQFFNTDDCMIDFKVYNRWGQMVFTKRGYISEWHGQSNNGEPLPDGTYYLLIGTDSKRNGTFDNYITRFIDVRRE